MNEFRLSPELAAAVLALGTAADETTARYWLAVCARRGADQQLLDSLWATWVDEHRTFTLHTDTLPDVFCPFASDGHCPTNPPCPTPRDRACTGDDDE